MGSFQTYCIYGLICPIENVIVYVGRTGRISDRISAHRTCKKASNKCMGEWMEMLEKKGMKKDIRAVVLESEIERSNASEREKFWISKLSQSHKLLNLQHSKPVKELVVTISEYEELSGKQISKENKAA